MKNRGSIRRSCRKELKRPGLLNTDPGSDGKERACPTADKSDRQEILLIYLTDEGYALRDRIVPIAVECIEDAVKGFTEEEVDTLVALLKKLILNL